MSEKMKNLWVRTVSGAVLAVVMLGAIAWSQWSFGLLLAALLVIWGLWYARPIGVDTLSSA